ncbi:MAG: GGDEF domain-containing protein [Eubacterium sp.]|nr:GGDEF domain-containing protein [Eubacterium sp.]
MYTVVITAEAISIIFLAIMLLGIFLSVQNRSFRTSTRHFAYVLFWAILGTAADLFSYALDGKTDSDSILVVLTMFSYFFSAILMIFFSLYTISVIREKTQLSYKAAIPVVIVNILDVFIIVIGTINGKLFTVENGLYQNRSWDVFVFGLSAASLLYLYILILRFSKKIGLRRVVALASYMFLPLLITIFNIGNDVQDLSYLAIAIAASITYVFIQANTIAEANLREKILSEASYIDSLTGLKNRRAYDEILKRENEGRPVGVVFCDMNALKYINDNFGHQAGDDYIKKFAKILENFFDKGEVCRISGDEFVVIMYGITESEMSEKMKEFRRLIDQNEKIAAFGYVYRDDEDAIVMINEAENKMYEDKDIYYNETGRTRRR